MRGPTAAAALTLAFLTAAPPAHAQALPDTVRAAGVTVAQWKSVQDEVKRAAAARGASEKALAAVAQRVSASLVRDGKVDVDELVGLIDGRAEQLVGLQTKLAALESADDPTIARLLAQAHAAINAGDLTSGDLLLAKAAESDLAAIALDKAKLATRQTRAAETIGERGQLASLSADYLGAAKLYAQAAETTPQTDLNATWVYRSKQGDALRTHGSLKGDFQLLQEAVRVYRDVAIPLVPRMTRPAEWAATQNDLGNALQELGKSGDIGSLRDAVIAYRAALEVRTRERSPLEWATTQINLGGALEELGWFGDSPSLKESELAFRAALEVTSREGAPDLWASTQNSLGNVLGIAAARGDSEAAIESVKAFRAALEVRTRERAPDDWAMTQQNLGVTLSDIGRKGDASALREAALAFRAALEIVDRERQTATWAKIESNLGMALHELGKRGDARALREAASAYRSALEVYTRENNAMQWAAMQHNLGTVLGMLAQYGDQQALREAVVAFRATLQVYTRERSPSDWADNKYLLALGLTMAAEQTGGSRADAITASREALEAFVAIGSDSRAADARGLIERLGGR